jgi:hypothetical protein
MEQAPSPGGTRKTRWAIIRNSYPELKSTTLKTWQQWVPLEYGKINHDSPITHHVKTPDLDMEVLFLALDKPDDQKKLLSLELTGAWVNEAREIEKAIIDALSGRVGRYPSKMQGGCTWSGIMMDTNPPDTQSWWYKFSEEGTPVGWEFFKQPSGQGPVGENKENLPKDYYTRIMAGKSEDWIKVYVHGEYGFVTEGKAVYPMYRDAVHAAKEVIEPAENLALFVGADFGLTPAAVIAQKLVDGRWLIIDELVTENTGVIRFAERLKSYIKTTYPEHTVAGCWGDPAGNQRAHSDERTALEIMRAHTGWKWLPAATTNELTIRLEVVTAALNRMVDGNPGFLLSPKCGQLRKGFAGGYNYKFIRSGDGSQVHETPAKNQYSHVHDALQYLLLGAGEAQVVLNKPKSNRGKSDSRIARDIDYNLFD